MYERAFEMAKVDMETAEQYLACAVEKGSFWAEILRNAIQIERQGIDSFKLDPEVFPSKGSSYDEYRLILEVAMYAPHFYSQDEPPRPRLEDWLNSRSISYLEAAKWVAYSWGREAGDAESSKLCLFNKKLLQLDGEFEREALNELVSRFRLLCSESDGR